MSDHWFRVPSATIGGVDGPKYRDRAGVTGHSGNRIGESPQWVSRFYGDTETLEAIGAESDTTALTASEAAERFSQAGVSWLPAAGWTATAVNDRFRVG